jgi:hypothetical protein
VKPHSTSHAWVQTILVKRIPLGLNDATIILLENDRFLKVENNVKR